MEKTNEHKILRMIYLIMMITLITYPKYAIAGAKKGLEICLYTVIPTLFPFCVLVTLFRSNSNDKRSKFICIIEHVLNLPRGVGSLIGFGLLGGYPVGALCVEQAVEDGNITSDNAKYLRPICNNAGPAFIIGIVSGCFEKKFLPLNLLWIQALSVLYTLSLLPQENVEVIKKHSPETMNVQKAITLAFGSMINICGIIILFRCFLNILESNLIQLSQSDIWVIIVGILELTNGITLLKHVSNEEFRFLITAALLSFGGLCVILQTFSISSSGRKEYIIVKILQTTISVIIAYLYIKLKVLSLLCYLAIFIGIKFIKNPKKKPYNISNYCRNSEINIV